MSVEFLPPAGIITLKALAEFLNTDPRSLQQMLSDNGVPVQKLSSRFDKRLVRFENLGIVMNDKTGVVE